MKVVSRGREIRTGKLGVGGDGCYLDGDGGGGEVGDGLEGSVGRELDVWFGRW